MKLNNLFDRNFALQQNLDEEAKAEFFPNGTTTDRMITFKGDTLERVEMLKKVKEEELRAKKEEYKLECEIKYKKINVFFGGSWSTNQFVDSVTIFKDNIEIKTVAVPVLLGTYEKEDDLDIPFILDNYIYFIHFDNGNERKQLRPVALYVPTFDDSKYTIGLSIKTLPWLQT